MLNNLAEALETYKYNYNYFREEYNNIFKTENQTIWESEILKITRILPENSPSLRVILVPSIINDSSIFLLGEGGGLVKSLLSRDIEVCICHWELENAGLCNFKLNLNSLTTHLAGSLEDLSEQLETIPQILTGYCLGGNIALGVSALKPHLIKAIGLLATPWDFSYMRGFNYLLEYSKAYMRKVPGLDREMQKGASYPAYLLQLLFFLSNPYKTLERITKLGRQEVNNSNRDSLRHKYEVEKWLYSCSDIPIELLDNIAIDFIGKNCTMEENWKVEDKYVIPQKITLPAFMVAPKRDSLVYPISMEKLIDKLPNPTIYRPGGGHLSFLAGKTYRRQFENKFLNWCRSLT
jgi:polyhydroxyalkanoate synthase